jgi:hypothetical protein
MDRPECRDPVYELNGWIRALRAREPLSTVGGSLSGVGNGANQRKYFGSSTRATKALYPTGAGH